MKSSYTMMCFKKDTGRAIAFIFTLTQSSLDNERVRVTCVRLHKS